MLQKLEEVERRYTELEKLLVDPALTGNHTEFARLAKERSDIEPVVLTYRDWKQICQEIEGHQSLLEASDHDIRDLAKEELPVLRVRAADIEQQLKLLLLPKDPNDERNVVLEIRAGTGGEEASLFAADLHRMYSRYADTRGWRCEVLSANSTGLGGLKEIITLVEGRGAYSCLKYESGVHRVQRVPVTEASGRIHTSAVTVAVLPEADDVEVAIDEGRELRIDVYRSSGPGGQSVNTTDSAVRITHLPTGLVVSCQDEKSQHKNKAKALKVLRARLLERAQEEQHAEEAKSRRGMVRSGDRSERIRTYNFPQSRVSDHRINLTLHSLEKIIDGDLDLILDPLQTHFHAAALKASS